MKFDGVRVLDLSQFLPGPLLTLMMADHGAEVIKIENPTSPEPTRSIGPKVDGHTVYFRNTQRGKKSVAVDLKTVEGREIVGRLAEGADVLVESFRPGVADRLGVGPAALRARAPRLVYCSLSAFGQTGSWRERPAHDLSVQALAGALGLSEVPSIPGIPAADMASSLLGLAAVAMALYRREKTGQGDAIDIAMYDSVLSWTTLALDPVFGEGRTLDPATSRIYGGAAFYRPYRCKDGRYITLGGSEPKFVETLLTALGRADLIPLGRKPPGADQAPLRRFLEEAFLARTRDEWTTWMEGRDICFAPVLDMKEAFDHPLATERAMISREAAGASHVGLPIKYAEEPGRLDPRLAGVGRDTEAVLATLGFDAAAIAALEAKGVIKRGKP
ncbi:MAG: CoA transferase [Alphaproteobacteria bacterium]|nr:CoA transferase [Alphaproteobacteria bacterium]